MEIEGTARKSESDLQDLKTEQEGSNCEFEFEFVDCGNPNSHISTLPDNACEVWFQSFF